MFRSQFVTRFGLSCLLSSSAAALALAAAAPAWAQSAPAQHSFDIPALPLNEALRLFMQQSGIQVSYASGDGANVRTSAVKGDLAPAAALSQLLSGTGLTYRFTALTSAILEPAPTADASSVQLGPVRVEASDRDEASGSVVDDLAPLHLKTALGSGALGTRSQLDTPFSITTVTASEMEQRQVTALPQAFSRDPSVSAVDVGEYTIFATGITVRGLGLDYGTAYKIDELPVYTVGFEIPYEHLERIDLLKGVSGFMYGFGAPGGIINYVTKKPTDNPVRSFDVGFRSDDVWQEHFDLGGRVDGAGSPGYRLNATHEQGSIYNGGHIDRTSASLAVDAELAPGLTWHANGIYQKRDTAGEVSALATYLYPAEKLPHTISGKAHLATDGTYNHETFWLGRTGLDYSFGSSWKLSVEYAYNRSTATYVKDFSELTGMNGDYNVNLLGQRQSGSYGDVRALLQGNLETGPIDHQLVAGYEHGALTFRSSVNGFYDTIGTANLFGRNGNSYSWPFDWGAMELSSTYRQDAWFASDTVTFTRQLSLLAGVRVNNYVEKSYDSGEILNTIYRKNGVLTPTVALMFKPISSATVYASYVQSLESGTIVGDQYANARQALEPIRSKQYEVGFKTEQTVWSASAALFRIERAAEYANANNVYVQNGLSVYQGFEASAAITPVKALTLGGGLMLLDAKYRRGSDYDGNRVEVTPKVILDGYAQWNVSGLPGLSIQGDVKYYGNMRDEASNQIHVPGYAVANASLGYSFMFAGKRLTARLQVNNLTNRGYWVATGSDQVLPGLPRVVALNLKLDF